jgi:putative membrane-bound dehydrogenase-like protein
MMTITNKIRIALLGVVLLIGVGLREPIAYRQSTAADQADTDELPFPFQVPPGFTVELVAGPPLVEHPMHACFDDKGRLLVADSLGINPKGDQLRGQPTQVIRLLEDTKGTGRFDKSQILVDKLVFPEGVLWHQGAVFTASPPSLWKIEDLDRKGGKRQELVTGFPNTGIADDLHGPSLGPDGRIYWGCGRFRHDIRAPGGPVLHKGRAPVVLRCKPDGSDIEVLCGAQGNPVKQAFTPEGEIFCCGTWSKGEGGRQDVIIHCVEGGNYPQLDGDFYAPEFKHTPDLLPPLVWFGPASASGVLRYRSPAFGPEYRDNLFAAVFNTRKVTRHVLERDGATFRARSEDFLIAANSDFRPSDVIEDADGSILVINTGTWSACCEAFRAGRQTKAPGSIHRIRRQGAAKVDDPRGLKIDWDKMSPRQLVGYLDDPRFAVRDRAVEVLVKHGKNAVNDLTHPPFVKDASVRARRNALWTLSRIDDTTARGAVRAALQEKELSLRLTACTSAGLNRDPDALPQLMALLKDQSPPVRREAATALGRLRKPAAVPGLLDALRPGGDRFLEHALVYALIQIGDRLGTVKGLADASPQVRRGAVIALDQMDNGNLTQDLVTPLLNTDDAALQKTTLAIISKRPGWGKETTGLLREWLALKEVPADRQESLRGVVLAFATDKSIQDLVAHTLGQDQTSTATRLLLLETMARAPLQPLPDGWIKELGRCLEHADERIVRQAIATIQAGRVSQFDDKLLRLANETKQPADVRVAAITAVAPRLGQLETPLFDFLVARLHQDMPPLARLAAASCLGNTRLTDGQLDKLTSVVAQIGALEMPHLAAAYERSKNPSIGLKLVAALDKSAGLVSLSSEGLTRTLQGYPPEVRKAAAPLFKKLEVDIEKMQARLAELEPVLQGGNAKNGREVFFGKKAACFACHTVNNEGGQVGPDLTKIGAIRSTHDLLVAIIFPSASFARGFEPYVITTKAGSFYPAGIIRRETADAITIVTGDRVEIRIPRAEIETILPGKVSIMPEGLDKQITRQELSDLLAYLMTLK